LAIFTTKNKTKEEKQSTKGMKVYEREEQGFTKAVVCGEGAHIERRGRITGWGQMEERL